MYVCMCIIMGCVCVYRYTCRESFVDVHVYVQVCTYIFIYTEAHIWYGRPPPCVGSLALPPLLFANLPAPVAVAEFVLLSDCPLLPMSMVCHQSRESKHQPILGLLVLLRRRFFQDPDMLAAVSC